MILMLSNYINCHIRLSGYRAYFPDLIFVLST